jgi:hypothetical protein
MVQGTYRQVAGIFAGGLLLVSSGCGHATAAAETESSGIRIRVEVTEVRPHFDGRVKKALAYGSLTPVFDASKAITAINLACVSLVLDGVASEMIYIDSVAHFLTTDYAVTSGKPIPVYWKMSAVADRSSLRVLVLPGCSLTKTVR